MEKVRDRFEFQMREWQEKEFLIEMEFLKKYPNYKSESIKNKIKLNNKLFKLKEKESKKLSEKWKTTEDECTKEALSFN